MNCTKTSHPYCCGGELITLSTPTFAYQGVGWRREHQPPGYGVVLPDNETTTDEIASTYL